MPLGGLTRNDISDFDRTVKGYFDPDRVESIRNELELRARQLLVSHGKF